MQIKQKVSKPSGQLSQKEKHMKGKQQPSSFSKPKGKPH